MFVRDLNEQDIQRVIDIWLDGSKEAHDFIEFDYWESKQNEMREIYLPNSETFVLEVDGIVAGFISLVGNYLAALFIDGKVQKRGYGKILLDFAKERRIHMELKVFSKNIGAMKFYLKNEFIVQQEMQDEETQEHEYVMAWSKR